MQGTIGPDVARAAVALGKSHPKASPREVLDVVMRGRGGNVVDFGDTIKAGSDFGLLIAEAFDRGMSVQDWQIVNNPKADPSLVKALLEVWRTQVLPAFAAAYGLTQ